MLPFSTDQNEEARLSALKSYNILDTAEEKDFDDLTTLASAICQTPVAFISLIDDKRQWFKSRKGIIEKETPIESSFCTHAIASGNDIMIVENAAIDARFIGNPLVNVDNGITFYAGVPLINKDGFALGSLCVVDKSQKQLTEEQITALKIIAKQVVDKLELRRSAIELEKLHQELIDSNLFIQGFAAMAAHDIKNPMSGILLSAQLIKVRLEKFHDKSFEKLLDLNINATKRLITMLDDMLAYSKSPQLLLTQKQFINSTELFQTVISLIRVPDNFEILLPSENHLLNISKIALQQILINLLTNAIRYNDKDRGLIQIRCWENVGRYYFEVEDNGIGIARNYYKEVFGNNFTLNITDRENKKGNGIGLSTVKELIKVLKGIITVHSVMGRGTTFSFNLPKT
ncbi:MAG TPA: GAF domain-containing sensor histidine kinase [Mucilaginibacter sp.]|jgi:signal transduction histidine kinase|nr:GAF domain-containing sensor histidine kinase [Mucilaginibacter sp.]